MQLEESITSLLDIMARALLLAPSAETLNWETLKIQCENSDDCRRAVMNLIDVIIECGFLIYRYLNGANSGMKPSVTPCPHILTGYQ